MTRDLKGCRVEFIHDDQIVEGTVAETLTGNDSVLHFVMLREPVTVRYNSDPVWIMTVKDTDLTVKA